MSAYYTVRYRHCSQHGPGGLIVEDEHGVCLIFSYKGFCCRLGAAHLARACALGWFPVPSVAPYTLEELQQLLRPDDDTATVPDGA